MLTGQKLLRGNKLIICLAWVHSIVVKTEKMWNNIEISSNVRMNVEISAMRNHCKNIEMLKKYIYHCVTSFSDIGTFTCRLNNS